jgi:hypothetical protein
LCIISGLYQEMLGNALQKRLSTQNWVDIMKRDSNPTQRWHRIRKMANRAINHLILLGEKMPDEKQEEIFDDKKIFRLMRSILWKHDIDDIETTFEGISLDARRTALAKTLVMLGTEVCIQQYKLLMKDTPNLAEPTISHLRQSAAICRDIAYRSELTERDMEAEKEGIDYLFEWNKIPTTNYTRRFAEFIRKEVKFVSIELGPIKLSEDGKNIMGTFRESPFESEPSSPFIVGLNDDKTTATFRAFDENGNERVRKNLMVKQEYDSIVVYAKKKN